MADSAHVQKSIEHNNKWLAYLTDEVGKLGLKVTPSVGNFVLIHFTDQKGKTAKEADAYLTSRGIIMRQVSAYHLPNCLRCTVGSEEANHLVVKHLGEFLGRSN
jgi:histidinol-phosphate aminotransferase